jgi:hypothetical protein
MRDRIAGEEAKGWRDRRMLGSVPVPGAVPGMGHSGLPALGIADSAASPPLASPSCGDALRVS